MNLLTPQDKEAIRQIVRSEARSARVDRSGLYVMVFFILMNSCSIRRDVGKVEVHVEQTKQSR